MRKLSGIPITTPARTLLDLAAVAAPRELEHALAEAQSRRLARRTDLLSLLARAGPRPGVRLLRLLVDIDRTSALTRSEVEERFLALIREAELPAPEVNVRIGSHEVDFLWRTHRLIVELDGFQFHSSRAAFERDRAKDAALQAAGYAVLRVTWRQLVENPEAAIARLAAMLAARSVRLRE